MSMKKFSWEFLRLETSSCETQMAAGSSNKKTIQSENVYFRARVMVNNKLGVVYDQNTNITTNDLIAKAYTKALASDEKIDFEFARGINYTACPKKEDDSVELNYLLDQDFFVSQIVKRSSQYNLQTNLGTNIKERSNDTVYSVGFERVPTLFLVDNVNYLHDGKKLNACNFLRKDMLVGKALFKVPWLLSPKVLSTILLDHWMQYFLDNEVCITKSNMWFSHCSIADARVNQFDLEGVKKSDSIFVQDGKLNIFPYDKLSALHVKKNTTGHCGYRGKLIDKLIVKPDKMDYIFPCGEGLVVIDAQSCQHQMPGLYMFTLLVRNTLEKLFSYQIFVKLPAISTLLELKQWYGYLQCGYGNWLSPWLLVEHPEFIFKEIN